MEQDFEELRKKRIESDNRLRERNKSDIRKVLAIPEGRRLLWKIMSECRPLKTSFVPNARDVTAYNEGRRSIGIDLMTDVQSVSLDSFQTMQKEAASDRLMTEVEKKSGGSNS